MALALAAATLIAVWLLTRGPSDEQCRQVRANLMRPC